MSLRRRLMLLCGVFLGLAVAASTAGAVLVVRARDARNEHTALKEAIEVSIDLETSLVTQAASIRAYFLDRDTDSYSGYTAARLAATDITGQLQGLVADDLDGAVEAVTHDALTWRTTAINPLIAIADQGDFERVVTEYRSGPAVALFDDVNSSMRKLEREIAAAERAARSYADATRMHAAEFGLGAVLATTIGLLIIRAAATVWLTHPIRALATSMRNADPRAGPSEPGGASELRDLGRSANIFRDRMRDALDEASRSEQRLAHLSETMLSLRSRVDAPRSRVPLGWDFAAQLVPAGADAAGDCFDLACATNTITLVVVDVAQRGAVAASAGLRAKELLRIATDLYPEVGQSVRWVSEQMGDEASVPGVTAFVVRIDCSTGDLSYASAGHTSALVCDGLQSDELIETGPLLGTRDAVWETKVVTLAPGQLLVCFTDGLLTGRTEQHARFGLDDLGVVMRGSYGDSCDVIVKQVLTEAGAFEAGRMTDDVVVAVVARAMPM